MRTVSDARVVNALRATAGQPESLYRRRKMVAHLRRQSMAAVHCTVDRSMRSQDTNRAHLGQANEDGGGFFSTVHVRNMRCITLDLRQQRRQELFRELVGRADVVVESFLPGTLEQ